MVFRRRGPKVGKQPVVPSMTEGGKKPEGLERRKGREGRAQTFSLRKKVVL
jgi:hypothetical protein